MNKVLTLYTAFLHHMFIAVIFKDTFKHVSTYYHYCILGPLIHIEFELWNNYTYHDFPKA